ncbi:MAG: hypothetical protein M0Q27_03300 [Candidatus Colwellbacteria bacterium]|nr:hypothetical protein [Candidatus Colwellbacteria bacterium]
MTTQPSHEFTPPQEASFQEVFDAETLPVIPDHPAGEADNPTIDPSAQLALMEKLVRCAPAMIQARNTLVRMFTYEKDWTIFGSGEKAKACLSAAGACRIMEKGRFPIRFHNVRHRKENITDKQGAVVGYRYVFEGYATCQGITVPAIGQYSTRDAFLGKVGDTWKDPEEINENYIRQAAFTYFKGSAIKDLLGLKNIPVDEYQKITQRAGQNADQSRSVRFKEGDRGGKDETTNEKTTELFQLLRTMAAENLVISFRHDEATNKVSLYLDEPSPQLAQEAAESKDPILLERASLRSLTTFVGRDGGLVSGLLDFNKLKSNQAKFALSKANSLYDKYQAENHL